MGYDISDTTDDASSGQREGQFSRRALLGAAGTGLASAVAGCRSLGGAGSASSAPASGADVFTAISFDGQQMVVELREGHSVERLNLIGPEGSEFESETVSAGETRATLQVIRLTSGQTRHYSPGQHELVAVTGNKSVKTQIPLNPALEISSLDWKIKNDSESDRDFVVEVKNTGSAPTWVYRLFYESVPNKEARDNTGSKGNPALALEHPSPEKKTILVPGESQEFVGQAPPLVFSDKPDCNGRELIGTVMVDSPALDPVKTEFRANLSGEPVVTDSDGFSKSYSCDDISVETVEETSTDG